MILRLLIGDCRDHLAALEPESIDAVVTDPPYDLTQRAATTRRSAFPGRFNGEDAGSKGFMGMAWDGTGVAFDPATWAAVARVMKPGAHLLAFGGTRTFHRMAVAIEDAGFEIRDTLSWLYASGFPKNHDFAAIPGCEPRTPRPEFVGTEFEAGWGTALKPAWEPIILARKPLAGTVAATVAAHGVGGLNIDGCRIGEGGQLKWERPRDMGYRGGSDAGPVDKLANDLGRWPANVALDEAAAALLDAQTGERPSGKMRPTLSDGSVFGRGNPNGFTTMETYGDTGGASRFFYCAKASRSERNAGLDGMPRKDLNWSSGTQNPGAFQSPNTERSAQNHHPTVKPLDLMRWLVRMVTPPGGTVLDPFMGSGTTGVACIGEGVGFIGIEREPEYAEIAERRIRATAPLFIREDAHDRV